MITVRASAAVAWMANNAAAAQPKGAFIVASSLPGVFGITTRDRAGSEDQRSGGRIASSRPAQSARPDQADGPARAASPGFGACFRDEINRDIRRKQAGRR